MANQRVEIRFEIPEQLGADEAVSMVTTSLADHDLYPQHADASAEGRILTVELRAFDLTTVAGILERGFRR